MPTYDSSSAECFVYTYKEGFFSAMGHDLRFRVGSFEIRVDDAASAINARFDARSLVVDAAMHDGHEATASVSARDRAEIEDNCRSVLSAARHPEIHFRSSYMQPVQNGHRVSGALTIGGVTHEIGFKISIEGARLVADVLIHQPDFRIKPYRAPLGVLKIKPDVRVHCAVPAPVAAPRTS